MYSYLNFIVYDKLLKPRQSFRITLYLSDKIMMQYITHTVFLTVTKPVQSHARCCGVRYKKTQQRSDMNEEIICYN